MNKMAIRQNILITGGAGFIGHHLIEYLLFETDHDIVVLDRLDYSGNLNRIDDIVGDNPTYKERVRIVYHDLRAEINPTIERLLGSINYIFHLAAGSHVDRSIEDPLSFVYDNVVGTCNILNYARTLSNLQKFLYFSTDEIFGPAPEGINYKERDRYNSTNPYSATKAGAEELCVAFENTYQMPIVITHTMNVIGERQHPEKFVPLCIKKALLGETIEIHSNADRTQAGSRFYIHAKDVAEAIWMVANNAFYCGPDAGGAKVPKFNIVGATEIDNLSLATMIAQAAGKPLKFDLIDFHSSLRICRLVSQGSWCILSSYPDTAPRRSGTHACPIPLQHPFSS